MATHLDLEEQEQLDQLKAFWKQYGNWLTWTLIAVLGAFAAYNGWNWWQRDQAINEVKASMILDRVADAENITIPDEELDRELLMLSLQSREPMETLRERLKKDGGLDRIREQMRREKTGSVLYEKLSA